MSLLVLTLTQLAGTNLLNTSNLQGERNLEYAGDSAVQSAIQAIRYTNQGGAGQTPVSGSPCPSYPSASGHVTINGVDLRVDCVGQTAPSQYKVARQVQLTACFASDPLANPPCPSDAVVTAQVLFVDLKPDGSTVAYGYGMNVQSWSVIKANG